VTTEYIDLCIDMFGLGSCQELVHPTHDPHPHHILRLQLMLPTECAYDIIYALGDVGLLSFKDLNAEKSAFQRGFASQVGG
jgi:hypothetical protein